MGSKSYKVVNTGKSVDESYFTTLPDVLMDIDKEFREDYQAMTRKLKALKAYNWKHALKRS